MPDIPSATGAYRSLLKLGRGAHRPDSNAATTPPTATSNAYTPLGDVVAHGVIDDDDGGRARAPASGRGAFVGLCCLAR